MMPPQSCIMFDLDGTLAPSKGAISPRMAALVSDLMKERVVAVVSGGALPQFEEQFLSKLDASALPMERLLLLPTSGAALYRWENGWKEVYKELLSSEDQQRIRTAIAEAVAVVGLPEPQKLYGEQLENRGSQMTLSWFGQRAPIEVKRSWDPNYEKRKNIIAVLAPKLPDCSIGIGGMTSIDITKKGIDKAYGIDKTAELLGIGKDGILYVGDALFEGGNDYAAVTAGVATHQVSGPQDTEALIASWLQK